MKTMFDDYTIPCTEEQTKKALELGAPIKLRSDFYNPPGHYLRLYNHPGKYFIKGYHYAQCPTAEQMIGWLEEQEDILHIDIHLYEDDGYPKMCGYGFTIYNKNKEIITGTFTEKGSLVYICPKCKEYIYLNGTYTNEFLTKKEATLTAIDAALEYLKNCKDCK